MWVLTSGMYDSMVHAIFYSNMIAPIIGDRGEKEGDWTIGIFVCVHLK